MRAGLTVEELLTERKVLEQRLFNAIQAELHAFNKLTGIRIADLSVHMVPVQLIGDTRPTYTMACVHATLDRLEVP